MSRHVVGSIQAKQYGSLFVAMLTGRKAKPGRYLRRATWNERNLLEGKPAGSTAVFEVQGKKILSVWLSEADAKKQQRKGR